VSAPAAARAACAGSLGAARTASAGIAAVGCAFGMARYGYGLLLPGVQASYHLGAGVLGLIAAGGYAAYLAATALAAIAAPRAGPRALVVAGGACAAAGMAVAGLTHAPAGLAAGVLVGGASAGLVFPPFSDVVARVAPERRERTMAAVSSGTGWGVAVAAPVAILAGSAWRVAWLAWAIIAAAATLWAAHVLPRGTSGTTATLPRLRPAWFVCPRSGRLLAGALLIGLGASVFWTFAVDLLAGAGGLGPAAARSFLVVVGVASIAGTLAGDLVRRLGPGPTLAVSAGLLAASLAVLGLWPASPVAGVAAGAAFGATYNAVVAVQTLWSADVFATRPSAGLAAVMAMLGLGLMLGPPLAGAASGLIGMRGAFLAAAVLVAASALLRPRADGSR
jgi:predicted MFS family arabinose efflux permease